MTSVAKKYAGAATALAATVALYGIIQADTPRPVPDLETHFTFEELTLAAVATSQPRATRSVHPDYERLKGWISSVGASVSLGDIDGDGISNEICLVDPRTDTVSLQAAPVARTTPFEERTIFDETSAFAASSVAPMGCLIVDLDADGARDLLVYFWGRMPVLYKGIPSASGFTPSEPFGSGEIWFTNAAVLTDANGDGVTDVLFGNYFPTGSGVLDSSGSLPVEMQHSMSRAQNGGENRLYLNHSSAAEVSFEEAVDALPAETRGGWTLALGSADLNDDGYPDIYVANDFGPDRLLLNSGKGTYSLVEGRRGITDIRSGVIGRDSFKGMGVDFGDLNLDGKFDIAVSNIAEPYALHESHFVFLSTDADWTPGVAPLKNRAGALGLARSGWSWDIKFGDFDNDGTLEVIQATGFLAGETNRWPELHELAMGNDELLRFPGSWPRFKEGDALSGQLHDHFFALARDGVYREIGRQVGLDRIAVTRGIALGDVDADGDLDIVVARQWDDSALYLNRAGGGKSLLLDLRLTNANGTTRTAIGAKATATLSGGARLVRQVDTSSGHSGANAPEVHFGLGETSGAVDVEVAWIGEDGIRRRSFSLEPGSHTLVLDQTNVVQHLP